MAATDSAAFNDDTKFVRLSLEDDSVIAYISLTGTASTTVGTNDTFILKSGEIKEYRVYPGRTLSAIMASGTATLCVEELAGFAYNNFNIPDLVTVQAVSVTT